MIEHIFFELLQVALGNRKTLFVVPTMEQWAELLALSKRQALVAIVFVGVNRLTENSTLVDDFGTCIGIDEMIYLKWLGLTSKVAQKNKLVSAACVELVKQYSHDGIQCCILKEGLGTGTLIHS